MWKFLSYSLTSDLSAYKNSNRIQINKEREIAHGDTCNQTTILLPIHLGTHIDFPYHFFNKGKRGLNYSADEFVFNNPQIVDISEYIKNDNVIEIRHFEQQSLKLDTDFLIIKTGFCENRFDHIYYSSYPGFSDKLAFYFKQRMPSIRCIGFDLISLSSPLNGDLGKKAHIEFLKTHDILLIEDMDLRNINLDDELSIVIASPLRFSDSDGAPVTVFYH